MTGAVATAIVVVVVVLAACSSSPKPHALPPVSPVAASQQIAAAGIPDPGPLPVAVALAPTAHNSAPNVPPTSNATTADHGPGAESPPADPGTPNHPTDPAAGSAPTTTAPANSGGDGPDECVVRGGETGVDTPHGPGAWIGAGDYPHCDYTAHEPAGYATNATSWEIKATHPDGTTDYWSTFISPSDPPCAPVGTIRPGDRVTIHLLNGADGTAFGYYLSVGPNHHC